MRRDGRVSGGAAVLMMQASDVWEGDDRSQVRLLDGAMEHLLDRVISTNITFYRGFSRKNIEGFLTAIAIGPVTVTPEQWLPRVFGGGTEDPMPEIPESAAGNPKVGRNAH